MNLKEKYLFLEFWYFRSYGQKIVFRSELKNTFFLEMLIYSDLWAKYDFSKWYENNVIFHKMLIFLDIWTKHYFFKGVYRKVPYSCILIFSKIWKKTIFKSDLNKCNFSWKFYFFMSKIRLFQSDLKIRSFSSKCWEFWTYGQKQFL